MSGRALSTLRQSRFLFRTVSHYINPRRVVGRAVNLNGGCLDSTGMATHAVRTMCDDSSHDRSRQSSSLDDNMIPASSLESQEFKQSILDFAKSFGSNIQDVDCLMPSFLHKSYLISNGKDMRTKYKSSDHLTLLGFQMTKRLISEHLYSNYSHLPAQQIWDIQHGIVDNLADRFAGTDQLMKLIAFKSQDRDHMAFQAVVSLIATIYIHEGQAKARSIIQSCISDLDEEKIQEITKLQHPKYILKCLTDAAGNEALTTTLLNSEKSDSPLHLDKPNTCSVGVYLGDNCIAQATSYSLEKAEMKACQNALLDNFKEQLREFTFSYHAEDFLTEDHINLGLVSHEQRIVELEKGDEGFGFSIRGGEKKRLKNEQWLIYRYYSPVFISSITTVGLADRHGGLRVGDLLLAVNDRSLVGLEHSQAVKILKAATGTVSLTVKYSKEAVITDEIEIKYNEMRKSKFMAELTSKDWAEWHHAQAHKNPMKYASALKSEQY